MRPLSSTADSRAALVARVRPLWPEPVSLRVGRRSAGSGAEYLVLPSLRRPVLLVPSHDGAAGRAIMRVDEGQRRGRAAGALAWAHQRRLLRLLPVARLRVGDPGSTPATTSASSPVLEQVRRVVPEASAIVVRLGRPRHGRGLVLQVLGPRGRTIAFAKCAFDGRVATLARERDTLVDLADSPSPGVRAPRVLGFVRDERSAVLVLEPLAPSRPGHAPGVPVPAMRVLATRAGVTCSLLADVPAVARLREGVAGLADSATRTWLAAELEQLLAERGGTKLEVGAWHGDWVAWNMARDDRTILLWDWEHFETGVPLGLDHVHHLAQELRLRVGTGQQAETRWLVAARHALAQEWALTDDAIEATLRTYLLMINLRFVADRDGDPDGPVERRGWSRELLARLGTAQPHGGKP